MVGRGEGEGEGEALAGTGVGEGGLVVSPKRALKEAVKEERRSMGWWD